MPMLDITRPITSRRCQEFIQQLTRKYPFCRTETLARTAFQRPISTLVIGTGSRKVVFGASFHGNEWITTLVLLQYAGELAQGIRDGTSVGGEDARAIAEAATLYMLPMVDPDGVDLVTGAISPGSAEYQQAQRLGENYPDIPFPQGWKANLLGVDLNLQFPARWRMARQIKFAQGYTRPGPRDYVGAAPLNQVESRTVEGYTRLIDPALVLALHSQGEEIYWQFLDYAVAGAEELGQRMAQVSGYRLAEPGFSSSFAGYKDWFIQEYRRPGYTIEVGRGENPLPIAQFPEIYRNTVGILNLGALG